MNNVQDAVTTIREAIKIRIADLRRFEKAAEDTNSLVLLAANRGGISELELFLEHLPEEKEI